MLLNFGNLLEKWELHRQEKSAYLWRWCWMGAEWTDLETVLQKRTTDFCSLYSRPTANREPVCNTSGPMANIHTENQNLDSNISIKAIFNDKRNKSPGLDKIPSDIFRNDSAVSFCIFYLSHVMRKPVMPYANNKGADQTAQSDQRLCCLLPR